MFSKFVTHLDMYDQIITKLQNSLFQKLKVKGCTATKCNKMFNYWGCLKILYLP